MRRKTRHFETRTKASTQTQVFWPLSHNRGPLADAIMAAENRPGAGGDGVGFLIKGT
jgi:hypothetical protein